MHCYSEQNGTLEMSFPVSRKPQLKMSTSTHNLIIFNFMGTLVNTDVI